MPQQKDEKRAMIEFRPGQRVKVRSVTGVLKEGFAPGATLVYVDFGFDKRHSMTGENEGNWWLPTWMLELDDSGKDG